MRSIGKIIATYRKKMGISQVELSNMLRTHGYNLSNKAVSTWEKDVAEPSSSVLLLLCKLLNITDIYGEHYGDNPDNPMSALNEEGKAKAIEYIELLRDSGKYTPAQAIIIPFRRSIKLFDIPASAGTGSFLDGENYTILEVGEEVPYDADFGIRISGDSMEPEFEDGQIAWVLKQDMIENGEIGIFSLNGEAYIKKLQDDPNGVFLISLNEKYPPIPVREHDRFDILGKVVGKNHPDEIKEYLQ